MGNFSNQKKREMKIEFEEKKRESHKIVLYRAKVRKAIARLALWLCTKRAWHAGKRVQVPNRVVDQVVHPQWHNL